MITPSTGADVVELAGKLSELDIWELETLSKMTPIEALSVGLFTADECLTGRDANGDVVCMFGVNKVEEGVGGVWLLSSPGLSTCVRELVETGRAWLDRMNETYPKLVNVVTAKNTVHIRLIKALGFTLGSPIENPNATIIPFERNL